MWKQTYKIDSTRVVCATGFEKTWCAFPDGTILSFVCGERDLWDSLKLAMAVWISGIAATRGLKLNPLMLTRNMKIEHCD